MFADPNSPKRDWKADLCCALVMLYFWWSFTSTPRPRTAADVRPAAPLAPPQSHLKGADEKRADPRPIGDIQFQEILGGRK
jgi:hypothetical protein